MSHLLLQNIYCNWNSTSKPQVDTGSIVANHHGDVTSEIDARPDPESVLLRAVQLFSHSSFSVISAPVPGHLSCHLTC